VVQEEGNPIVHTFKSIYDPETDPVTMKIKPNLDFMTVTSTTSVRFEPLRGDAGNHTITIELKDVYGNKNTYFIEVEVIPVSISSHTNTAQPDPTDFDIVVEEDTESTLYWDF